MEIKVLGPGCRKCEALYSAVNESVAELGIDADVKKVEDINEIVEAGVMMTPGLVINGKLKAFGKVPGKEEIKRYIKDEM